MQTFVKQREVISGVVSFETPPVDVSDYPLLTTELIAHQLTGTAPVLKAILQTSGDLETWTLVGSAADAEVNAAGASYAAASAAALPYGRYVRYTIDLTGTSPFAEYSLILNTFASS